jgi:phosphopantetheine adenylyltransferase
MKLLNPYLKHTSMHYFIQLKHRKDAIETAIAIIADANKKERETDPSDVFMSEISDMAKQWIIETLIQGAYIREYHIWEKDTKEYVLNQKSWNGCETAFLWRGNHVQNVKSALTRFSAEASTEIMDRIDAMRNKVNAAKHEPGVLVEHFVSNGDYCNALQAIESFWDQLHRMEEFRIR